MKPSIGYEIFVDPVSVIHRCLAGRIRTAALSILLLLLPLHLGSASAAAPASGAHVYLLRGVLNVFSLGLDEIAAKLQARGIPVTVANFVSWSSLAQEAASEYRSGRVRTIILVGHSSGATALPDMVARLGQLGVPVKLAIGLDSVFRTKLAGHADRYINFYIASGAGEPVTRTKDFRGALENVDVQNVPGVGHISIDKNEIMQQKVVSAIEAAVFSRRTDAPGGPKRSPEASSRGSSSASAVPVAATATPQ
jgi:hypothetical protein